MKGTHAFSPTSGAELSDDRHRPGTVPLREALDGSGELTNGQRHSSRVAIGQALGRVARRRDVVDDVAAFRRAAAPHLLALKRATDAPDWVVWLALAERLHRDGRPARWLLAHVDPVCPRCGSVCGFRQHATRGWTARCGAHCGPDSADRTGEIHERVHDAYEQAFGALDGPLALL